MPERSRQLMQKAQRARQGAANAPPAEKRRLGRIDIPMLTLVLILLLFGLVMLFSASYPSGHIRYGDSYAFISSQVRYAILGVVAMIVASMVDYHILKKFAWPLMAVAVILLVVALIMPAKNGAHRWIWFNSSRTQGFQPSELAKFALILLFAYLISAHQARIKTFQYGFLPFMVILGVLAVLLILEPHLSCTILIMGIGISMMFAGGTAVRWFGFAGITVVVALYLALSQFPDLVPYATERIETWLNPFGASAADAHQTIQSMIAVGSGGVFGRGIGNSTQKFLYLPEMYNDYIFAVLCEELGMIGALVVIVLFLLLLARGLYIAMRAKDKFGGMLVVGVTVQIALQAFLHIAVNLNAIPSTGISLPFFSSGGSSLVMLLGQVGILLSVSRQATLGGARPRKEEETGGPPVPARAPDEAVMEMRESVS